MILLSPETISHVDAHANAYADEHWNPKSAKGTENRSRLELVARDLNLLDSPTLSPSTPALEGRDEAMYAVLSDLALKASALMREAPQSELHDTRLIDSSIALDPVGFEEPQEALAEASRARIAHRAEVLRFHGAPSPSLHDRGPMSNETADRVSETAARILETGRWKTSDGHKLFHKVEMHVDRLQRLERNRKDVTDPELRAAYDLLHNDHAIKVAGHIVDAVKQGDLNARHVDSKDMRLMRDPHNPSRHGGLAMQAAGLKVESPILSKGPVEAEVPAVAARSAER
jgi:hypothetical protein